MPNRYPQWWNWGWKEVVQFVRPIAGQYDAIVIVDTNGMPYIYTLLYGGIDPGYYQQHAQRTYVADRFGFEHVEGFGNYLFPTDQNWEEMKASHLPKSLYIVPGDTAGNDSSAIHTIYYPDGRVMTKIFSYE